MKAYSQQIQLPGKKVIFFQSVAERTNDTALYTYMKLRLQSKFSYSLQPFSLEILYKSSL